jgi:hypothetical protein
MNERDGRDERDDMQTRAETAPKTKPSLSLVNAIDRAKRNDGHGLTPGEVLTLAIAAEKWLRLDREI